MQTTLALNTELTDEDEGPRLNGRDILAAHIPAIGLLPPRPVPANVDLETGEVVVDDFAQYPANEPEPEEEEEDTDALYDELEADELVRLEEEAPEPYGWGAGSIVARLKKSAASPIKRFTTGLPTLDLLMRGGYGVGEMTVIAGNSGSYKSMLASWGIECNVNRNPDTVMAFASLEMAEKDTAIRSIAQWHNSDLELVLRHYDANSLPHVALDNWAASHSNVAFICASEMSIAGLEKELLNAEQELGQMPQLVFLDYLELITMAAAGGQELSMVDRITKVAIALKNLAKRLNFALVVLHHTNASSEDGRPVRRKDVRYAGYAQSDMVLFTADPARWYPTSAKEAPMPKHVREELEHYVAIGIIKNRNGKSQHQGWLFRITPSGRVEELDRVVEWVPGQGVEYF